ncbi:MAG: hypothetical protein JSU90_07410 [Nitrospiraceae bacterium]|nr:MAG: hypothetical protein JSU90_07410 [Nitrospiraceae bacterium]
MLKLTTTKRLCPHLEEPFEECYCVKMGSQDIERAVYLCSLHFEICDIYKHGNGRKKGKFNPETFNRDSLTC